MHASILLATLFAIAITAAPTPSPTPAPSCTPHCCQSLHEPDNMSKLLTSLNIARSDITGMLGLGCITDACPSTIVGVPSCCSGPVLGRVVTSGCAPVKW